MPTTRSLAGAAALLLLLAAAAPLVPLPSPLAHAAHAPHAEDDDADRIARVLDDLHDAASKADADRYFALFAESAVFLGTDASERWTLEQFKAYAKPHFDAGRGWTYLPRPDSRHIEVRGDAAWFDELLDNAKYGQCRGSGVLLKHPDGRWLIAQYNLSVPIPNDLLPDVAQMIRQRAKQE